MTGLATIVMRLRASALDAVGGRERARTVLTLAAVLGLSGADTATIAATTGNLERTFGVGNTEIGLLLSVVALTGAVCTIPVGVLTDRTRRTWLLAGSIVAWAAAMAISGAATSYLWLLLARLALGAVTATTGPTVASLTGDYFPSADRGRIYGLIIAGELVGSGIGFVVSGDISSLTSWRVAFWWLVLPSLVLAWLVWRLPEPARGRSSRPGGEQDLDPARPERPDLAGRVVAGTGVQPQAELVLHRDPAGCSLWWAVRYVLRVRTNVVLIAASALGYFYFAGLRSFAILFATSHYGVSKPTATALVAVIGVGAVGGVYAGGRFADRLLRRGHARARVAVPMACLLALPLVLAPAIASASVAVALPLLILGAFLLGAPNPPLDAARLDIMHPRLWGRAEAIRTAMRSLGEAAAPTAFGYVSQFVFGGPGAAAGGGSGTGAGGGGGSGLEYTFLVFLVPLLLAGLLALAALRTYPRDVATATASIQATSSHGRVTPAPGHPVRGRSPAARPAGRDEPGR
jgi:predicted MFS family arabinose efflux permease